MAFGPNPPPIQAHICVNGGTDAIAFCEKAFGANRTITAMADDGQRVMHANLEMFGGEVMMHGEFSVQRRYWRWIDKGGNHARRS